MNDWMVSVYFFVLGAMLVMMLLSLGVAVIMPGINKWSRCFFISLFAVLVFCILACLFGALVYARPNMTLANRTACYLESLLPTIPMPMFTLYLLYCCEESWRKSALFYSVFATWAVYLILLQITQFTTFLYYISPQNEFYRGSAYPLLVFPLLMIMVLNLTGVIRRKDKLSSKYYIAFLIHLLPFTLAILIHTFVFNILIVHIGIAFSALSMFCIIIFNQVDQYMLQQQEISQQHASIMVLQMRPHFIYNTMMSIYYLCKQNPDLAQQVTLDFTTYLRKNFTAIASENPIPFSEELEHTRAYLAVEQAQFEDRLFVEYDIPHTQFRLPPLTLQPIVENAVKHGMDPDSDPLYILIRTRKTDSGSEILVEDNGSGFEPSDPGKPHIALVNIQQRLEMMCRGKLKITPRKEGGTVVTVFIP